MKLKLKKGAKKKLILILILTIVVSLITISIFKIIHKVEQDYKEVNIIEQTDNYNIKITYPRYYIDDIDKKLDEYIKIRKQEFINAVQNKKSDNEIKYDFIVNGNASELDRTIDIQLSIYSYTGGANYIRDDYALHYDKVNKEYMDLSSYFNNSNDFNKLDDIVYYKLMQEYKDKLIDETWVRRGVSVNNLNYKYFSFREEGLEVLFPPYQVGPASIGEVKILIPYNKINKLLKEVYRGKESNVKEEIIPPLRDLKQFKDKKLIAFTFDDGPNTATTKILLDGLDAHNAKVTFFVLGSRVKQHQEILKEAYMKGNQIGNHSYNHRNFFLLDKDELKFEMDGTSNEIEKILGVKPTVLRPPYGNINKDIRKLTKMHTILWDIDTEDWKNRNEYAIRDVILSNAHDGAIVLLHDLYETSVKGALLAMNELEKEGYAFVTIDEMAALRVIELDNSKSYFSFPK